MQSRVVWTDRLKHVYKRSHTYLSLHDSQQLFWWSQPLSCRSSTVALAVCVCVCERVFAKSISSILITCARLFMFLLQLMSVRKTLRIIKSSYINTSHFPLITCTLISFSACDMNGSCLWFLFFCLVGWFYFLCLPLPFPTNCFWGILLWGGGWWARGYIEIQLAVYGFTHLPV